MPELWPVTTANSYLVGYLLLTVVAPTLFTLWWYRHVICRPLLALVDAVGLLAIKLVYTLRRRNVVSKSERKVTR